MSVEGIAVRFKRMALLTVFAGSAACMAGNGAQQPSASPLVSADSALLQPFIGWYRFAELGPALVTWGAETDLALMIVRDTMLRVAMIAAGPDSFAVPQPADRPPAAIRFMRDSQRSVAALRWSGQRGTFDAPRVGDGEYDPHPLAFASSDGVRLAATLFLPRRAGPHPAAVMVHGSGTSTRDNSWYMTLVDAMASNGIAVLLPDKRGSGESGGDWRTADLELLARDALAGAATALRHPAVDGSAVGLVGISQGGQIAVRAAVNSPSIRYVVNISGSGVPLNEQLRHEVTQDLRRSGWPGFLRPLVRSVSLRVIRNRQAEWWERNGGIDPIDGWRALQVPALVVYGADDEFENVPVNRSVERLEALSKPDLTIRVFAESGHALYEPGSQRIRRDVLSLLPGWIRETTAVLRSARTDHRSANERTP